ncbi:MAG: hypothetical protein JNL34_05520 [Anaerolineae bacterium]|nr:hypothetical protein [Anaerolineae bacterium]
MIALLNDLCALLSQADVDAHRVAAWLGEILHEGELGMPYTVRPTDPHLAGASVIVAQDGHSPLMVELNLAQPYALEALRRAFPDHSIVPRRDGREDLAAFVDLPEQPFTCAILASHDHGSAMTDFIRVRRDERIA